MRGYCASIVVALAMPSIGRADAPKGHYDVRTNGEGTCFEENGTPCKPCGRAAHDHLVHFSRAHIVYGSGTIVNDDAWLQDPPVQSEVKGRGEVAVAHERLVDHAEYRTLVEFYLIGKAAIAAFSVFEFGPSGAPVCHEILILDGTYRPLTR